MDNLHRLKTHLQLFFILLMMAVVLVGLSLIVGNGVQPQRVAAQEPLASPSPPINTFSMETLESYGLSLEEIEAAAWPFTLQVTVSPSSANISSGGLVTFTVTITNVSPTNPAQYIYFSQSLPSGMTGGAPVFGPGITYVSDGRNPATYLLTNQILASKSVTITVSGTLSTICNTQAMYQTRVDPFEGQQSSNIFSTNVNIIGTGFCLYLPLVRRDPTPTPLPYAFYDDFSGARNWSTSDDNDCSRSYEAGEYEIKAKTEDKKCFGPAPEDAERERGTFKVKVRRESGSSDFTVAIYANGEGGKTFYALEVDPADDCDWRLLRFEEDKSTKTLRSGDCNSAINRNSGSNVLELRHLENNISAFVNGTQLGSTYSDSSDLDGEGTGIYVRTNKDDDVTVRFDDFTVIQP